MDERERTVLEEQETLDVMEEEEGSDGDAASSSASCLCANKVITASKRKKRYNWKGSCIMKPDQMRQIPNRM